MDLAFTPEELAFRRDVRAFIAENMNDAVRAEMDGLSEGFGVSPGRHSGALINDLFKKIGQPVEPGERGPGHHAQRPAHDHP